MRETLHRLTCDVCGLSVTVLGNTESHEFADGWKEYEMDDFGYLRARYREPSDLCPECFKRLRATVMEIRKEAANG